MDSFINLAKQGYEAYNESQNHGHSNVSKTGGQEYNSPHHSQQDGQYGDDGPYIDHHEAVQQAQQHHGSGDSSMFSAALNHLKQNKNEHSDPVDEEAVQDHHRKAYAEGGAAGLSAGSMGGAAALQVLKQFTGGSGGGGSSTQLVSMAMAEASKLFDSSGGAASGNKQDAINGAAMTVMKLMVQSKLGIGMGGGNSGGMGSLMGLASKFL